MGFLNLDLKLGGKMVRTSGCDMALTELAIYFRELVGEESAFDGRGKMVILGGNPKRQNE